MPCRYLALTLTFIVLPGLASAQTLVADASGPANVPVITQPAHKVALMDFNLRDAAFTFDGLPAKLRLDYNVRKSSFAYLYIPGIGVAVVSRSPFAGAVAVKDAFHDGQLSFRLEGHDFTLENGTPLVSHGTEGAFVRLDSDKRAVNLGTAPLVGFGSDDAAPYAWPLALADTRRHSTYQNAGAAALPLPKSLEPLRMSSK